MKPSTIPTEEDTYLLNTKKGGENVKEMLEHGVIEGPLSAEEAGGWLHNVVITDKSWNSEEVRINIDMKLMNKWVKYPIPTLEEL